MKKLYIHLLFYFHYFTIHRCYLTTIYACDKNMGEMYFPTPQQPLLCIVVVLIISVISRLLLPGTWRPVVHCISFPLLT